MMKVLRGETPGQWAPPLSGPCLRLPSASRLPNLVLPQSPAENLLFSLPDSLLSSIRSSGSKEALPNQLPHTRHLSQHSPYLPSMTLSISHLYRRQIIQALGLLPGLWL